MAKYNFSSIKLTDIEGTEAKEASLNKPLGNAIYAQTQDLGLVDVARKIYKGEEVELDKGEVEEVKRIIEDPQVGFLAFAKKAILDYMESVK